MSPRRTPVAPETLDVREILRRVQSGELDRVTTEALQAYGPELITWLCSSFSNEADAYDAFSLMSEDLWRSLSRFDGRCSLRTWCYMLARHASARVRGRAHRDREELVSRIPSVAHAVTQMWTTTNRRQQRTDTLFTQLRTELEDEDQVLLVLRVDRDLAWRDIAQVLLGEDAAEDEVTRKAATLRKQFERIKAELKARAARAR